MIDAFSLCQDRDVRLSKSMSYALRHGANQMGLHMGTGELDTNWFVQITKYIYSSTALKYNFEVLVLYLLFPFDATLYFHSTTFI